MKQYNMTVIGAVCRRARRRRDFTQKQVADMTGYSVENICAFEKGRNSNARLLLWYMLNTGLTINELKGEIESWRVKAE